MNLTTNPSILLPCLLFFSFIASANAFPGAAGHCETGDLSGKSSGHGETGGGPLSNGLLRVRFDDGSLSSSTTNTLNANQEYTVTLDFSTTNSAFYFRGLLFRLSGKNGEDVSGTMYVGSDGNVQQKSGCAADVSAMTHTNRLDKTSVSFNFEYTGSSSAADLLLEVTVVRERAADNWFYSSYDIEIGSTSSCPPDSPFLFSFKWNGERTWKACIWALVADTELRCQRYKVRINCPTTCNQCNVCQDSKGKFELQKAPGKKIRKRRCDRWVSDNPAKRCQIPGIADACRNLCGTCTS